MEPADAFAGVNQHSAEGMGVFFDEGQKVLDITESRIGGEFYLEGQELSAMLQNKVDFLSRSGSPVKKGCLRNEQFGENLQMQNGNGYTFKWDK
jgi:hypothetical protein